MSAVSVILAVYNGEKYLREAIESVLEQTHSPIEIIVVDDGSQDGTRRIAQNYGSKVRYHYQENRGQPAAQNQGILLAQSPYVAFLDGDDLYLPAKTALQIEFLKENPQVDFVFGYIEQFFSPELPLETTQKWICPAGTAPGYVTAAALFRKECFDKAGLFNEEQKIGVFIEWYMRAEEKGLKNSLIPDLALKRRIHANNMGIQAQNLRLEYVQIVKAALRRRALANIPLVIQESVLTASGSHSLQDFSAPHPGR